MIKTITITEKYCDLCGERVEDLYPKSTYSGRPVVYWVTEEIYYGDMTKLEMCIKCYNEIAAVIGNLKKVKK